MLNKILNEFQGLLKGKNGVFFLLILALVAIYFFFQLIPILLKLGVAGAVVFVLFKFLEKKR